ncbi:hypothetical protein VTK56DRAFT_8496 [Thermocarpiscus australiensis]
MPTAFLKRNCPHNVVQDHHACYRMYTFALIFTLPLPLLSHGILHLLLSCLPLRNVELEAHRQAIREISTEMCQISILKTCNGPGLNSRYGGVERDPESCGRKCLDNTFRPGISGLVLESLTRSPSLLVQTTKPRSYAQECLPFQVVCSVRPCAVCYRQKRFFI